MFKRWLKRLFWLIILLLIAAVLILELKPHIRRVDVAEVAYTAMQVSVEDQGKTRVINRYIVSAPVPGTSCRIDLNVGDYVEKNQSLVSIEPLRAQSLDSRSWAEARSRVSATESALRAAEKTAQSALAKMELANKELARINSLGGKTNITQNKRVQAATFTRGAKAKKRSADFAVDIARHEVEAAHTALKYVGTKGEVNATTTMQVRAPVSGRVLKILHDCRGVVAAGQQLFEIGDTQSLETETAVLSSDAVKIKPGMRVVFNGWGGEMALEGRVRIIEPVGFTKASALGVEEQRVLVISDITSEISQWQSLGDGYRVESEFILWEADNILQVPVTALFHFNGDWAIFVLENEKANRRVVKLGMRNASSVQILEGLAEGEKVIIYPDDMIEDGAEVMPSGKNNLLNLYVNTN